MGRWKNRIRQRVPEFTSETDERMKMLVNSCISKVDYHSQKSMYILSDIVFPQVFAFVVKCDSSVWGKFNWSKLTTVALANFYDAELVCHAHRHGVRVVKLGRLKCTFVI